MPKLSRAEKIAKTKLTLQRLEGAERHARRATENRRKYVIGGTVINAMEHDPDLRQKVTGLLQQFVTRKQDKEAVALWLSSD